VPLEIKLLALVKLYKGGEPFKMSKRAGTFVTLRDVVEMVGPGVTRFTMLTRKNDAPLDFDLDKALEQSRDNPVWYVQYAHARCASVLRKAAALGMAPEGADLSTLNHPAELALIRRLADFPRQVEIAARAQEPHRIAGYLADLAADLHGHWNRGNDEPALRFLQDDPAASAPKLALARATAVVISAGLAILGVEPLDEMR
jgi:arginyl-tRNA synthetase